ncbi:PIN-like domain-containing protein [Paenibacillus sp. FSL E2-8871]|uniref:PIN-like domain-containing protein n=1 Tax=Paenibacillus sp. FSL E2-8871 TaxID=2975326 RepID=UPI0030F4CAD4
MRKNFEIFYVASEENIKTLWDNAVFVLDANVLLNLYRYSSDTSQTIMKLLENISDRLWIPHQVALEYNFNRVKVINEQIAAYRKVQNSIETASNQMIGSISKDLNTYKKRHPVINVSAITEKIELSIKAIKDELLDQEKTHPDFLYKDDIRNFLDKHFEDKVGGAYNQAQLDLIFSEGEERYKQEFPPGYKDLEDKLGKFKHHGDIVIKSEYGDLIVWKQIIDFARDQEKSIIFVTDDAKEDWWLRDHGRTVGPRIELLNEFHHETGKQFYMYESHRFIEYGQNYLNQQVNKAAVEEIKEFTDIFYEGKSKKLKEGNHRGFVEKEIPLHKGDKNSKLIHYITLLNEEEEKKHIKYGDIVKHDGFGIGIVNSIDYEYVSKQTGRVRARAEIIFGEGKGVKRIFVDRLRKIELDDAE